MGKGEGGAQAGETAGANADGDRVRCPGFGEQIGGHAGQCVMLAASRFGTPRGDDLTVDQHGHGAAREGGVDSKNAHRQGLTRVRLGVEQPGESVEFCH